MNNGSRMIMMNKEDLESVVFQGPSTCWAIAADQVCKQLSNQVFNQVDTQSWWAVASVMLPIKDTLINEAPPGELKIRW